MPKLRCSKSPVDWEQVRRDLLHMVEVRSWTYFDDTEDVVQESIARYLQATRNGRVIEDPLTFMWVTAKHYMIDRSRKEDRFRRLGLSLEGASGISDERLDAQIQLAKMDKEKVRWLLEYEKGRNHPPRDRVRALRYRAALRCAT